MSLRNLPEIRADHRLGAAQFDLRPDAIERWQPDVRAASEGDATISIYDAIGDNWDGTGVTAKRIGAALRNIGARDVTVNVNSPGGDFFEGVAIYNLLREHQGKVTVRVMGLAASAASVIAMAGDEILMGDGSFLMIHNAWAVAIGNRHDMADAAALAPSISVGSSRAISVDNSPVVPANARLAARIKAVLPIVPSAAALYSLRIDADCPAAAMTLRNAFSVVIATEPTLPRS